MRKTKTKAFGTGKREGHDAREYYARELTDIRFPEPACPSELVVETPPPGAWADTVYQHTSESMTRLPDNSVAVAFTSPPYNVGKDYDDSMSLEEYLRLIEGVAREVYRVLRPGGRYVVNIANIGRKPYIPLHALFYERHWRAGFMAMGEIIWVKGRGASGNCAWGSWKSAKSPRLRDLHEYLLVFAKQAFNRPDKGVSDISGDEFMQATLSVWDIKPESARRVGHPAPFPVELAQRVIKLYSFVDEVVLDPFAGSGSTCVAALLNHRRYVGYEINADYCAIAEQRLFEARKSLKYRPSGPLPEAEPAVPKVKKPRKKRTADAESVEEQS